MTKLNYRRDNFDQDNTFSFIYSGPRGREVPATGYLFYAEDEGQIYIMKRTTSLKSYYTEADHAEMDRLNAMTPVRDGDTVEVEGKQYRVKILGNYSPAGRLIPA